MVKLNLFCSGLCRKSNKFIRMTSATLLTNKTLRLKKRLTKKCRVHQIKNLKLSEAKKRHCQRRVVQLLRLKISLQKVNSLVDQIRLFRTKLSFQSLKSKKRAVQEDFSHKTLKSDNSSCCKSKSRSLSM